MIDLVLPEGRRGANALLTCAELELRGLIVTGGAEHDPGGWDDPESPEAFDAVLIPMELTGRARRLLAGEEPARDAEEVELLLVLRELLPPTGYTPPDDPSRLGRGHPLA